MGQHVVPYGGFLAGVSAHALNYESLARPVDIHARFARGFSSRDILPHAQRASHRKLYSCSFPRYYSYRTCLAALWWCISLHLWLFQHAVEDSARCGDGSIGHCLCFLWRPWPSTCPSWSTHTICLDCEIEGMSETCHLLYRRVQVAVRCAS